MFKRNFLFELKRLVFSPLFVILILCVFVLLVFVTTHGINDYKQIIESKGIFQKIEQAKIPKYFNYSYYGLRGVRYLLIPSPISAIFNNSSAFDGLIAHIDTAEKLTLSNSYMGRIIFKPKGVGFFDYSGIALITFTLWGLIYGFFATFRSRKYFCFLADCSRSVNPAFFVILSRLIISTILIFILNLLIYIYLLISGIVISPFNFLVFVLNLILVTLIFQLIGSVIGNRKKRNVIMAIAVYFVLILLLPGVTEGLIYIDAQYGIKATLETEYEMFLEITKLEQRLHDKLGPYTSGKEVPLETKLTIKSGQEAEFKRLKAMEKARIRDLSRRKKIYHTIAALCPTTFYLASVKEISSKGYKTYFDLYRLALEGKYEFIKFYAERNFFRKPSTKVESFIKGDGNLLYAKSNLPESYDAGILTIIIWVGVLTLWVYLSTYRDTHPKTINPGQDPTVKFKRPGRVLAAIKRLNGAPDIDDRISGELRHMFSAVVRVYPDVFYNEDFKVNWVYQLFQAKMSDEVKETGMKRMSDISNAERLIVILDLISSVPAELFVFYYFADIETDEFRKQFKSRIDILKKDCHVFLFSRSVHVTAAIGEDTMHI